MISNSVPPVRKKLSNYRGTLAYVNFIANGFTVLIPLWSYPDDLRVGTSGYGSNTIFNLNSILFIINHFGAQNDR